MQIVFNVFPNKNLIEVSATYITNEIQTPYFLINRDFVINKLICDGIEVSPEISMVELSGWFKDYTLKKVEIPENV